MPDEWWLRPPPKNADEGIDELFEDVNEGVDDTYHANSSAVSTLEHVNDAPPEEVRQAYDITPEQLKEGLPRERGPSGIPDGWGEPVLTVPTKVVTNLVLVFPLTKCW
jgi:hypothetical protein